MAVWSGGYFTDVPYTSHFYPELAPSFMAYACLRQGVRPPHVGPGASYLELGCGQGYGLNLLAAANPAMSFHGVDFHPGQIANARRLAAAAGLANVTFEDHSFEQMLALPQDQLQRFDIVALHGIWSWVGPEARNALVRILDRTVKPGGLVYVSYNCLPGWAPLVGLQRFVLEHVARHPGRPAEQVRAALRAALEVAEARPSQFAVLPGLKAHIEGLLRQEAAYLIHELLNERSQPFFHADVARELEPARLAYAASAHMADDAVHLAAPAPLQPMVQGASDPVWRETLLDFASSKPFRRDLFLRGANPTSSEERDALLDQVALMLLVPPEEASFEVPLPIGKLAGDKAIYGPVVDALAGSPRTIGEIRALPSLAAAAPALIVQSISLLIGTRQIHPMQPDETAAGSAAAFNRAVLDRLPYGESPHHLAAGAVGTGVRVEPADLASLGAQDAAADKLSLFQRLGVI